MMTMKNEDDTCFIISIKMKHTLIYSIHSIQPTEVITHCVEMN